MTNTTNAKCPSCGAEKVEVKGRGNATCMACHGGFNSLPLAFATLKRAGIDGAKLQSILGSEGKKISKCVSCTEMFTTFPLLGETLHACVPCQVVWLANGAMERFHRVAVGAGREHQAVSTATMQMAVANITPPQQAKPTAAASASAPAPGASSSGFGAGPSTLILASAAPGSAEPSVGAKRVIEASLDPPQSLEPPAAKPTEPPRPSAPSKRNFEPSNPPSARSGLDPVMPPASASTLKPPPTSKPFNLTSGPPPADPKDKPTEKTGETKKAAAAEKAAPEKKKEQVSEHKKPNGEADKDKDKDKDKKKVANAPVLYVDEGSGGMYKAAAAFLVVLIAAFVAWRFVGQEPVTAVGSGKLVRFGVDSGIVAKGEAMVGKRKAIKHVLERPKGELTVWFVPGGGGVEGAGGEQLLAEVVGKETRLQEPRTFGGLTILNGTLKQGDKGGRVRAFFSINDAWILTALSKDAGFAESPEAEKFLASFHDAD